MNNNWDWVRTTYGLSMPAPKIFDDEEVRYPSCIANGLSLPRKRRLLRVYAAACQHAQEAASPKD